MSRSILATAAALLGATIVSAQRGPAPDPLVRENSTVKLADHTYVIPDANVSLVPNVGIVVGSKATLVLDPGPGTPERRNRAEGGGESQQEHRALRGVHALPSRAHHRLPGVSPDGQVRQLDDPGEGIRRHRDADGEDVLGPLAADRGAPEGCRNGARPTSRSTGNTPSTSAACACAAWSSGRRTPGGTRGSSSTATACSLPATW